MQAINCKNTCAIILALSMVGATDAVDFSAMWHAARSSFNRVIAHRYTKPAVISLVATAVVVGGASYLIKKSYDQRCQEHWEHYLRKGRIAFGALKVPGRSLTIDAEDIQIKVGQVNVLDQCCPQGCGGASCGYQTLKNAVGIASLAKGHDWSNWLSDPQQAAKLFAKSSLTQKGGEWREAVILERKKRLLGLAVANRLKFEPPQQSQPALNNVYPRLCGEYIENVVNQIVAGGKVGVTIESFIQWVQRQNITLIEGDCILGVQRFVQWVKMPKTIESYFKINPDAPEYYSLDMIEQLREEHYKSSSTDLEVGEKLTTDGEWLYGWEVQNLHKNLSILPDYKHLKDAPLTVIDSSAAHLTSVAESIRKTILEKKLLEKNVYQFAIHSGAHWTTVVLDICDGSRRYTLADSLNNCNGLRYGAGIDFINKLEGGKLADRIHALPDNRSYSFKRYCAHMWRRVKSMF